jgi:putative SOS response-associated peptidase YedK
MPVILSPDDYGQWLKTEDQPTGELIKLLKPYSPDEMVAYPVSKLVNTPHYDSADLIKPV